MLNMMNLPSEATQTGIVTLLILVMQAANAYIARKSAKQVVKKIDENTAVNVEALNVANGHNEKIAVVTEIATQAAAASLETIMSAIQQNAREIAEIKATSEETRRLVQVRLAQAGGAASAATNTGA